MKSPITPDAILRAHDRTVGPVRLYDLEKRRSTQRLNALYGKATEPHTKAVKAFAADLFAIVSATHRVRYCDSSSTCWVSLQFEDLPPPQGRNLFQGGEISVFLPSERNQRHPHASGGEWKPAFPFVTIRMPGAPNTVRRFQLSPRETPASLWSRCARFMDIHAKAPWLASKAA